MARYEFTGGLEEFASEGSADAGLKDEPESNAPAIEAFPSESPPPARAPRRSPEEVAFKALAAHADHFQQLDNLTHPIGDSAVARDMPPVYAPSGVSTEATESERSAHATRPSLYRYRRLTMAAPALLLLAALTLMLAALVNLLPADGSGVSTSTPPEPATSAPVAASVDPPAGASPEPVPSGDADRTAGAPGATPPAGRRPTTATPSPAEVSGVGNGTSGATPLATTPRPSSPAGSTIDARRLSSDGPVGRTAGRRENPPGQDTQSLEAPPVNQQSPATGSVASARVAPAMPAPAPAAPAPAPSRDDALAAAPAPSIATRPDPNAAAPPPIAAAPPPAANTVARTEVHSVPTASTDTDRTPPLTSGSEAAAPAIPVALAERRDAAAEAAAVEGINATLRRLQRAYEQRDARLARAVWPTVNERALARAFEGLRSQSVTFDRCRMNILSVSADVECRGVMSYVPRIGNQDQRTESRQWTFRVRKGDDQWLITNAEAR